MYAKKWKEFPEDDQGYAIYHRLLPKENATNLDIALVRVKPGQTIPALIPMRMRIKLI